MAVPSGTSSLLLGRERDIAELGEALGLAGQGSPQVVLVGGEAGIATLAEAVTLEIDSVTRVGPDVKIVARPVWAEEG